MKGIKTKLLCVMLIGFLHQQCYAQDVWLQNFFSPNSGCELSNALPVNVLINNNSGSFIPANSIAVSYSINAGVPISEMLGVNLGAGASWNFTFGTNADLSACGTYNMKVWVDLPTDPNPLNDTLTWVVQNDCIIVPGSVISDETVCEGLNGATLDLIGWTNGTIIDWQTSTDSGSSWTGVGNTSTSNVYTNIDTTTLYHVIFDGGFCPDDTSDFATITVQPFPVGGTISSSATHCIDDGNGTLTLSGASGAVIFWQYSENNGASWTTIANSTNTQDYIGLTMDTWYRTSTDGAICPNVFSDTAIISIDELTIPGNVSSNQTICEGSTVSLTLLGHTGSVLDWESSEDLVVWTPLGDTDANYDSPPLSQTTYFRVHVQSGVCADMYSDTVMITVDPLPVGGIVNSSTTHCETSVAGTLNLVGSSGAINFWEYSDDGGGIWNTIGNTTTSEAYAGLTTETWYRVQLEGGTCADVYSDTAIISIDAVTISGTLTANATICEGSTVSLELIGYNGGVLDWESSEDLALWTPLGDTDGTYDSAPLTQTTYYRVQVQNGVCPDEYSDTVTITVDPVPVGGTFNSSTTHCETSVAGTLNLTGSSGTINFWEYSDDGGGIWNTIANTTASEAYAGLTTETWYRVQLEGGTCADVYSDTAIISIDAVTIPGTLTANATICEGNTVSLELLGYNGGVLDWESSEDLALWTPLGDTDATYDSAPLTQTTYYRVQVQNGVCPDEYSDTVTITVDNFVVGGNINNSMTYCVSDASDTLVLVNHVGSVLSWEQSTNEGVSWVPAPGIDDSLIFSGLTDTIWYRVFIPGGACPDVYSDTAIITIWQDSYAGILVNDATICEGESVDLQTVGSVGTSFLWESSEDAVVWNGIANDTVGQTVAPTVTTTYRVVAQNYGCPEDTTNLVQITVNPLPIVDAGMDMTITEFDTIQLNGSSGANVLWSPSYNMSDSSIVDPFIWPSVTTTYSCEVTTVDGCVNWGDVTITVNPFIEPSINIRNVVTANGDGFNDFWMITGIEDFPDTEVHIFNMYGQEVYQSMDYQNDWGGTYNGNKLPNGTYHYVVILKDSEEVIKGNLTLLGNE